MLEFTIKSLNVYSIHVLSSVILEVLSTSACGNIYICIFLVFDFILQAYLLEPCKWLALSLVLSLLGFLWFQIRPSRPMERCSMSRRMKTVSRTYGGSCCHKCVRERIVRAFLIEEQKIVVRVLRAQQTGGKK